MIGVSNVAIKKAVDDGRISRGWDAKAKKIIRSEADKEYGLLHRKTNISEILKDNEPGTRQNIPPSRSSLQLTEASSTPEAKRVHAIIQAQLLALELKEKKGELVRKDAVYKELFQYGQQVRTGMQAIPDRVIDNLLAAKSRAEAHNLLTEAIHEVLQNMTGKEFQFEVRK